MNLAERMVISLAKTKNPQLGNALEQCVRKGLPPMEVLRQANEQGLISQSDYDLLEKNIDMVNQTFHINLTKEDIERLRRGENRF